MELIQLDGADSIRWVMLSDSPPERDLEWAERGVVSSYKFINKIWDLSEKLNSYKPNKEKNQKSYLDDFDKIINEVSSNIESFHFNKSVAKIYEYVNLLTSLVSEKIINEKELLMVIKKLTIIIHPFIPHISEEIWSKVGESGLCAKNKWPTTKKSFETKILKMPIQINGKTRSLIEIKAGEEKGVVIKKVMTDPKIIKNMKNMKIIKTIYIKNKIVNLVAK